MNIISTFFSSLVLLLIGITAKAQSHSHQYIISFAELQQLSSKERVAYLSHLRETLYQLSLMSSHDRMSLVTETSHQKLNLKIEALLHFFNESELKADELTQGEIDELKLLLTAWKNTQQVSVSSDEAQKSLASRRSEFEVLGDPAVIFRVRNDETRNLERAMATEQTLIEAKRKYDIRKIDSTEERENLLNALISFSSHLPDSSEKAVTLQQLNELKNKKSWQPRDNFNLSDIAQSSIFKLQKAHGAYQNALITARKADPQRIKTYSPQTIHGRKFNHPDELEAFIQNQENSQPPSSLQKITSDPSNQPSLPQRLVSKEPAGIETNLKLPTTNYFLTITQPREICPKDINGKPDTKKIKTAKNSMRSGRACIYAGHISQFGKIGPRLTCLAPKNENLFGGSGCASSQQVSCNLLIFGTTATGNLLCVDKGEGATKRCYEKSKATDQAFAKFNALLDGPSTEQKKIVVNLWTQLQQQFKDTCETDEIAKVAFCEECSFMALRLQDLRQQSSSPQQISPGMGAP